MLAAWPTRRVPDERGCRSRPMSSSRVNLAAVDAEVDAALARGGGRQSNQLELIAPKNYMSRAAREALASIIAFTSVEGYPGERWHAGTVNLGEIEDVAAALPPGALPLWLRERAAAFGNTGQPGRLLRVARAGRERSQHVAARRRPSQPRRSRQPLGKVVPHRPLRVHESDGLIDYDQMDEICRREQPRLIVGGSSYPRAVDFARCHGIARSVGAYVLADIAHFSGLVAAGIYPNPSRMSTSSALDEQESPRPRGGLILC